MKWVFFCFFFFEKTGWSLDSGLAFEGLRTCKSLDCQCKPFHFESSRLQNLPGPHVDLQQVCDIFSLLVVQVLCTWVLPACQLYNLSVPPSPRSLDTPGGFSFSSAPPTLENYCPNLFCPRLQFVEYIFLSPSVKPALADQPDTQWMYSVQGVFCRQWDALWSQQILRRFCQSEWEVHWLSASKICMLGILARSLSYTVAKLASLMLGHRMG